jgi:hypothetical protein
VCCTENTFPGTASSNLSAAGHVGVLDIIYNIFIYYMCARQQRTAGGRMCS